MGSEDVITPRTERKLAPTSSSISRLLELLPRDQDRSLYRFVAWLSGVSHRISWDPVTYELTIDGAHKSKSNLVDILTYLKKGRDGVTRFYPSAHPSGTFVGIPLGTSHFIEVVGQELFAAGHIKKDPVREYEDHIQEVADTLHDTFSLDADTVKETMALSLAEHERVKVSAEEKTEKERFQRMDEKREKKRVQVQVEKMMKKIEDEEEKKREARMKKIVNQQKSRMFEDIEKKGPKRGIHGTTLGRKMKESALNTLLKRGAPKWSGTILQQIADLQTEEDKRKPGNPVVRADAAYKRQIEKIVKDDKLTDVEKMEEVGKIKEQIKDTFEGMRSVHEDLRNLKDRAKKRRAEARASETPRDVAEKLQLLDDLGVPVDDDDDDALDTIEEEEEEDDEDDEEKDDEEEDDDAMIEG